MEPLTYARFAFGLLRKLSGKFTKPEMLLVVAASALLGFFLHMALCSLRAGRGRRPWWESLLKSMRGSFLFVGGFAPSRVDNKKSSSSSSSSSGSTNSTSSRSSDGISSSGSTSSGSGSSTSSSSSSSNARGGGRARHVAVIMDGNRRFGREKHSDALQGHWAGGQTLVDFVQWCKDEGLEVATLYAFSSENWARDPVEVTALMAIFAKYAESLRQEATERNVRVCVLSTGNRQPLHPPPSLQIFLCRCPAKAFPYLPPSLPDFERLPPLVQQAVRALVSSTSHCSGFTVNVCLSYGARAELAQACSAIATEARREGYLACSSQTAGGVDVDVSVSEEQLAARLHTAHTGDPDLLIRTSGEHRLSNFLLWQLAYTELFFVDKYWPEMTRGDLQQCLKEFADRHRRYGS